MAHTFWWPKKTYFYAVGNTVPVCLTQDIPPEEPASVLLLGCGDPRNILFTVYASGANSTAFPRDLDFTCCDLEPAVLARNLLLFSLILDGKAHSQMWNIFYDFFLKKSDVALVAAQSRQLADLAKDIETWNGSKYGPFLRVCTLHTLAELRRHWLLYADFKDLPVAKKTKIKESFSSGMNDVANKYPHILSSLRSAGPLLPNALSLIKPGDAHHAHLWRKGVNSMDPQDWKDATELNPLFVYSASGDAFSVHYGTDPLTTLPLAPAFAELKGMADKQGKPVTARSTVQFAQGVFEDWCAAFKAATARPSKFVIRFFSGDALSFCRAIHFYASTSSTSSGVFTSTWTDTRLDLDSGDYGGDAACRAPVAFDVIDTSNLVDHLGLLNVIVVTIPLLIRKPSSVIFTEALLAMGPNAAKGFMDAALGDLTVMSVLLDLTPTTFISKFTTNSNIHELALRTAVGPEAAQYHERTSWKILSLSDPHCLAATGGSRLSIILEPIQLATFLFGVYQKMFADENMMAAMAMSTEQKLKAFGLIHYVRSSFALLLRLLKDRTQTDWSAVMDGLYDLLDSDRSLVFGSNYAQDLNVQLHILGVFSLEIFQSSFIRSVESRFRTWKTIPTVLCITLVVPRSALKKLKSLDSEKIGTPVLQCEVRNANFLSYYPSIHAVFGNLKATGEDDELRLSLVEDPDGWEGRAPLAVSFWVPTWLLANNPNESIRVNLAARQTVSSIRSLRSALGSDLLIHGAALTNKESVFLSRERPNYPGELEKIAAISHVQAETTNAARVSVTLNPSSKEISTFSAKLEVVDEQEREVLSGGAAVSYGQVSTCGINIIFGSFHHTVFFPFPVDVTNIKLRIARKSHYIEIIIPPAGPATPGGFFVDPFPLIFCGNTPTLWNMHRVHLDRMPAIDITKKAQLGWLNPHVTLMMSDRERRSVSASLVKQQSAQQTLIDIKESLHAMYVRFTGLQGDGHHAVYALNEASMGGMYTLIFIADLRLDVAANTAALDAYVLPITHELVNRITPFIQRLNAGRDRPVLVNTVDNEMRSWKSLLPALAERARHSWKHTSTCEYLKAGKAPVSLEYAENPLCSCGNGKDVEAFRRVSEWAEFSPLVTRIALSPLFAVSYLEEVGQDLSQLGFSSGPSTPSQTPLPGVCAACGGSGKPRLLSCARCKNIGYCTAVCQRGHWRLHKANCVRV
ncbi:hypothetical protein FA95DRAFT_1481088 [Auriscalpium vulgare]|uniref:Uncharacterized protein n=1 Tax=Auriscalpium vulgare TaxID=40419 RepID=A0ACB8SBX5_9AGAM|nr:hypothetical protein FA95DRAFT_1481088 [Auriscalpium vulgare]